MVKGSCQLLASSYQPNSGLATREAEVGPLRDSQIDFGVGLGWRLVAGSWQLVYNQRLQRLSVRRSCTAGGSLPRRIHLTANGSGAVLRRGNEPMRNPVLFESVA